MIKYLSDKVIEFKFNKVSKSKIGIIQNQFKTDKIFLLKENPVDGKIDINNIIGRVSQLHCLHNKVIVRCTLDHIKNDLGLELEFKETKKDGFVLLSK